MLYFLLSTSNHQPFLMNQKLLELMEQWVAADRNAGPLGWVVHYHGKAVLEAGADLKSMSEILGHADPSMTLRTYQHTSTARRRDAIDRLGNPLPKVTEK